MACKTFRKNNTGDDVTSLCAMIRAGHNQYILTTRHATGQAGKPLYLRHIQSVTNESEVLRFTIHVTSATTGQNQNLPNSFIRQNLIFLKEKFR